MVIVFTHIVLAEKIAEYLYFVSFIALHAPIHSKGFM